MSRQAEMLSYPLQVRRALERWEAQKEKPLPPLGTPEQRKERQLAQCRARGRAFRERQRRRQERC